MLGGTGVTEVNDIADTTGVFTENVTGLTPGGNYSYVAFATNSGGTTYTSPVSTFTTLAVAPTVTTPTSASITTSTASLGGDVTSTGGAAITQARRAVCADVGERQPDRSRTGVTEVDDAADTTGVFTENVTGLTPGTSYSFVAFATNSGDDLHRPRVHLHHPGGAPPSRDHPDGRERHRDDGHARRRRERHRRGCHHQLWRSVYALTSVNSNPMLGGRASPEVDDATGAITGDVHGEA